MSEVRCSVVIPCRNGAGVIARQLRALAAQECPVGVEVVVADNGSTDDLATVVARFGPAARVVDAAGAPGINVARNAGIRAARGELILLCDADDEVRAGWIDAHWRAYRDGARLLGGPLRRVGPDGRDLGWQRSLNDSLDFLPWPTGANCGVAADLVAQVGEFDERWRGGGDETDFFWRAQLAGARLVYVEDAAIDYVARPTLSGTFRQSVAYGRSHALLYRRYRRFGMPRQWALVSLAWIVRQTVGLVLRRGPGERVALARSTGQTWGRIAGSVALRTIYV